MQRTEPSIEVGCIKRQTDDTYQDLIHSCFGISGEIALTAFLEDGKQFN
ncbi:unnamed protein product [Musa acuminata var. zebrina]